MAAKLHFGTEHPLVDGRTYREPLCGHGSSAIHLTDDVRKFDSIRESMPSITCNACARSIEHRGIRERQMAIAEDAAPYTTQR